MGPIITLHRLVGASKPLGFFLWAGVISSRLSSTRKHAASPARLEQKGPRRPQAIGHRIGPGWSG